MTDSFVTQCPHCRTSFRVSRAQLGAAHGAVRCGACLHVFNATQHLLGEPPASSTPSAGATVTASVHSPRPVTPPPTPASAPPAATAATTLPLDPPAKPAGPAAAGKGSLDTLWIHDDLDLDSLDLDEELAKLEEQEMQLSREFLAIDSAPKPGTQLLHADEEDSRHDESWAESLIKDEPPRKTATMAPVRPRPEPAPEPLRAEPQVRAKPVEEPPAERDEPPLGNLSAADEEDAEEIADGDYRIAAEPTPTPAQPAKPVRSEPALRDDSLLELSEDPLHLDWQQPKKPWGRWIGWGLLNLIAAGALATQYTVYHFEELARQDQYRPWFEAICPEIGCTLPSKVDIAQIRSTNLVVRSHPQYMDALMVDAILYNRAQFAQPFPLLELRFADLNGQLIASSRFRPSEYLSGELAGQDEMPPQTPIHISLEIKDPGAKAVNYSLSFHSPE